MRLDPATGGLTPAAGSFGCFADNPGGGCIVIPGAGAQAGKAIFTPDGLDAYSAGSGTLINFATDAAPGCQPVVAALPQDLPATIHLSCADPNGDPVTLSATVSTGGFLGVLDQAAQTVTYLPSQGYAGPATLTYTATAKEVTSTPATVSLTVLDTQVSLGIKGTVRLTRRGRAKTRLTCPASERSGPCRGRLGLRTRARVEVGGRKKKLRLGSVSYSVAPGVTRTIKLRVSRAKLAVLRHDPDAKKLLLRARVADAAGNHLIVKKKARLVIT
jgi:hypothetical protein